MERSARAKDEHDKQIIKSTGVNKFCIKVCRNFYLTGHFNYAFIYGSWEVIRARKVGTTHTRLDYVVYRFFYPVLLTGACLFGLVAERQLGIFFCLMEVWSMILHISYSVIFLQNVLFNNLHRQDVKDKQKIPERLIVTDEVDKGGHKFYTYKRISILPTEELYHTERLIYLLFNIFASVNVTIMVAHSFKLIQWNYNHDKEWEQLRTYTMGVFVLLDVFLTPIPIRLAHAIYPFVYCCIYGVMTYLVYAYNGLLLYTHVNWRDDVEGAFQAYTGYVAVVILVHALLCFLSHVRDFIISCLDDSKTEGQMQNLRCQKRLARRKVMNYIEGPDGRIIGISLDKRISYDIDEAEEVIKTADEDEEGSSSSSNEEKVSEVQKKKTSADLEGVVPITTAIKPPPRLRYKSPPSRAIFSSSSSEDDGRKKDDLAALKKIQLPSPPRRPGSRGQESRTQLTKLPIHFHKLGLQVKPRDSKEAIHRNISTLQEHSSGSSSPPTPPMVKLVETLMKADRQAKEAVRLAKEKEIAASKRNIEFPRPTESEKAELALKAERPLSLVPPPPVYPVPGERKPIAGRIINAGENIKQWDTVKTLDQSEGGPNTIDFHAELVKKLQSEQQARRDSGKFIAVHVDRPIIRPKLHRTLSDKIRSILKGRALSDEEVKRESERRKAKLLQRREQRLTQGVHGKPVYDPLEEPDIERSTTFHLIGSRLKVENEKTVVSRRDLEKYRNHPGVGTSDTVLPLGSKENVETTPSTVSFHPIVQYYDLDESKSRKGSMPRK